MKFLKLSDGNNHIFVIQQINTTDVVLIVTTIYRFLLHKNFIVSIESNNSKRRRKEYAKNIYNHPFGYVVFEHCICTIFCAGKANGRGTW